MAPPPPGSRSVAWIALPLALILFFAVSSASGQTTAVPPQWTIAPLISGTAQQGQTLASDAGTWTGDGPITYGYQWWRCDSTGGGCAYTGATGSTYLLGGSDVGSTFRTIVTATNSAGSGNVASAATALVAAPPVLASAPQWTVAPVVSGSVQQGQSLSSSVGTWTGTAPISYGYQWWRCDSAGGSCAYTGATGSTYLLGGSDVGSTFRTIVTATNSAGSGNVASAATALVAAPPVLASAPQWTVAPVVSGSVQQGQSLSSSAGTWTGTAPISYTYQWWRCDSTGGGCAYTGATGSTYLLGGSDVGSTFRTIVTATNSAGSGNVASAATALVAAPPVLASAPQWTVAPVVSGSVQQGQSLSSSAGTWTGTAPIAYGYQWWRCDTAGNNCASVSGASGSSYLLAAGDVGFTFRTIVTATNSAGSGNVSSAASAVVTAAQGGGTAPQWAAAPVISGTAQQGQTLTSSTGTWTGTAPTSYGYQWWRCDSAGGSCAYTGATGSTYVLGASDVGSTFRTIVTATNSAGSGNVASAATAPVAAGSSQSQSLAPQAPAAQCSRASLASCPASYFTGPLGNNNLIPAKPGAFLIDAYGGVGTSWAQMQAAVLQRETDMGRKFDGVAFSYGAGDSWGGVYGMTDPAYFSPRPEQWIHDHGSFPVISWTPNYTIAQINSGAADAIFAKAANYWKTYGFTIMLRPFVEFDNPAAVYSAMPNAGNGNTNSCGSAFISAWQRMVNIFKQNGASNVGFWWTPEEGYNRSCVTVSYPGDAYVDWTGSDWYNTCLVGNTSQYCTPLHSGWASFNELFNYTALGSAAQEQHNTWGPHKPFVIGETASWYDANSPSSKGQWFRDIPAAAKNMLYLRGICFYDADVSSVEGALNNFRVDYPTSDSSVYAGFKAMAADPWLNTGS